ncbi:hypothetical protein HOY82DRAFT_13874 [Tuber indicum]|nr:hypothetical protein HOY82DRAFT_13874 [Tuber indicum]
MADKSFARSITERSSFLSSLFSSVSTTRCTPAALWPILIDNIKQPKMVGAVLCGIPLVYVGLRSLRERRSKEEEVRSLKGAPDDGHSVHSNYESLSNASPSVSGV